MDLTATLEGTSSVSAETTADLALSSAILGTGDLSAESSILLSLSCELAGTGEAAAELDYLFGAWTAPERFPDPPTWQRGAVQTVPLLPVGYYPQFSARLEPEGVDGPAYQIWLDVTGDGNSAVFSEDTGVTTTQELKSRRFLSEGFLIDSTAEWTEGSQFYLDTEPGAMTLERPSIGKIVLLGEAVASDTLCIQPPSSPPPYVYISWEGSSIALDSQRYLYEFGGDGGEGVWNHFRRLDLRLHAWEDLPAGCTARKNAAMVFVGTDLYVYGGEDENGNALSTLCIFHSGDETPYWEGPIETTFGARISPQLIAYQDISTGQFVIAVVGGYNDDGPNPTVFLYQTGKGYALQLDATIEGEGSFDTDGSMHAHLKGKGSLSYRFAGLTVLLGEIDPSTVDEGPDAPEDFVPDMDWGGGGGSTNTDDAFTEVACSLDAPTNIGPTRQIGTKLYAIKAGDTPDMNQIVEFDTETSTFTVYSVDPPPYPTAYDPNFLEESGGRLYWFINHTLFGEIAGVLSVISWAPGEESWTNHGYKDYDTPRTLVAVAKFGSTFRCFYVWYDETCWIDCTAGSWGDDQGPITAKTFYDFQINDGTRLITQEYVEETGGIGNITVSPYTQTDISEARHGKFGVDGSSLFEAFIDSQVYRYDLTLQQWSCYMGTLWKNTPDITNSPVGDRVFIIGNYMYVWVVEYDENWENPKLCVWKFDLLWSAGTGIASFPVSISYLNMAAYRGSDGYWWAYDAATKTWKKSRTRSPDSLRSSGSKNPPRHPVPDPAPPPYPPGTPGNVGKQASPNTRLEVTTEVRNGIAWIVVTMYNTDGTANSQTIGGIPLN